MKKLFSLFAALLMVGGVMAEVMDTVYYVNTTNWDAVKVHAWGGTATGTTWPGLDATKATYQLQGADVYYFVAAPGAYAYCIFNNGNGTQSADLTWTPGMYFYEGAWKTRQQIEQSVEPQVKDTFYLVNSKGWGSPKVYFYGGTAGQLAAWPGVAMTKVNGLKADGFDVYYYAVAQGAHANVIFNNGSSVQSGDLTTAGNAGKYFNFADQTWYANAAAVQTTWYLNANYNGTTEWRVLTKSGSTYSRRDVYGVGQTFYNGMASNNLQSEIKGAKLIVASDLTAGDSALYVLDPYAKTINITKIEVVEPVVVRDTVMYVAGSFTSWADDKKELPYTHHFAEVGNVELKLVRSITTTTNGVAADPVITWHGQATNGYVMTRDNIAEGWLLDGGENVVLQIDVVGDYTFSLTETGAFMVTFPSNPTAVENVEAADARKVLENGRIVIVRDGVRYSALGQELR